MSRNPILLITAGPTGSGKGSLKTKIEDYLFSSRKMNWELSLVDNLIEKSKGYKKRIEQIKNIVQLILIKFVQN